MTDEKDDRTLELKLADQEWLTEDARECARLLFLWLPEETQREIIEQETWEWQWLLWSPISQLPAFPPSYVRRLPRDHQRRSYPKRY